MRSMCAFATVLFLSVLAFGVAASSLDAGIPISDDAGVITQPFLPPAASLKRSASSADVEIRHLHMVVDRKDDRISVTQVFTLGTDGVRFESRDGYCILQPRGAIAPRIIGERGEYLSARILDDKFIVTEPIMPGGGDLAIGFDLPINDGVALIEQKLKSDIAMGRLVLTWTQGNMKIESGGFEDAKLITLQSGLNALVAMGRNVSGQPLTVRISGFVNDKGEMLRQATMVISILLLLTGFVFWIKRRGGQA